MMATALAMAREIVIRRCLWEAKGNISKASRIAGISRPTFYHWMYTFDIKAKDFE